MYVIFYPGPETLYAFGIGFLFAALLFAFFSNGRKVNNNNLSSKMTKENGNGKAKEGEVEEKPTGIAALPSELRFIICVGGIYACYLTFGVLQEKIYKFKGKEDKKFSFTFFLLFVQCVVNAGFAKIAMSLAGQSKGTLPLQVR